MFEYAFNLPEEGKAIRHAVDTSMDAGIVTEDIAQGNKACSTSEVGDFIQATIAG
jgi:3-isopropylmalate dehydrogenase